MFEWIPVEGGDNGLVPGSGAGNCVPERDAPTTGVEMHRFARRTTRGLVLATLASGALAGSAAAAGTITVDAGGVRTPDQADATYAAPLAGVAFERATWVADPATAAWTALCATDATGSCTAGADDGRFLVRVASGPVGWRSFPALAWGGAATGASPSRAYVGDVTVAGDAAVVHPSTVLNSTAPNAGSGPFVVARDNPVLPDRCALDVLLVLDRSGSIQPSAAQYRTAAQGFVDALAGTPVRLKIASFAVTATLDQATFLALDDPADVAAAKATIAAAYAAPAGGTNWDGGLALAATTGVDLVTFVTDGNPTVHLAAGNAGTQSTVGLLDLTAGVASANLVKTQGKAPGVGATIRAVGVGDVTASNLSAISGPVEGTDWSASGVDQLRAELRELANRLCGGRIHVRKLTDAPDPATPKAGWTISASSQGAAIAPASLVTAGGGADDVFGIDRVPAAGATVRLAETQQAGFVLVGAGCRQGGFGEPAPGGTTAPTVQRGDDWYCTFRNLRVRSAVDIEKSGPATVRHGDTARFTFVVRNPGNVPLRNVRVGDDRCPGVTGPTGDDGNGTLEPAEVWTYTCSYVVGPHADGEEDPIRNEATVTAVDPLDQPVTASDTHTTAIEHPAPAPPVVPAPAPAPAPAPVPASAPTPPLDRSGNLDDQLSRVRGTARMRGTTGCAARTARATVTGRRIRSVSWSVDGKQRPSPVKPGAGGRWTLVLQMGTLRTGTHRVQARVRFVTGSGTAARQLVMNITRCKPKAVAAFTG